MDDRTDETSTKTHRRWGAVLAVTAVLTGIAVVLPQLPADGQTQPAPVTCTLWALAEPSVPITGADEPAEFSGRLLQGTARCEDPQGQITGARYEMPDAADGVATCEVAELSDPRLVIDWVMADGSSQQSTVTAETFRLDETGPHLENAVVEGGPESVAGAPVTVSADQTTIDAATAAAETQCLTGGVKNVTGNIDITFG
ncbi:hypothetical protein [Actinophytocola gossypii]|uniref:Ig-like domain-containing protein n=1 Tax=Actinophytocola gossypii TaxID=2812003 RepID=A0ABT2J254_9PSEU|nr:hypothetical protein [Actinophytocola gossypii]MCT2581756.1 hypothetical protein [Actinophytocola gossypii]